MQSIRDRVLLRAAALRLIAVAHLLESDYYLNNLAVRDSAIADAHRAIDMRQDAAFDRWRSLLRREWIPTLAVLLGGVLLQSMSVLMVTTVLPSIVSELGGAAIMGWPTAAFLASSIVASSCAGMFTALIGPRAVYCAGVATFGVGALLCSLAQAMSGVVASRFIQGFGGGLEAAVAYVVVREVFPEWAWPRTIALLSSSWSISVLLGPLVGGMFARFGDWRGAFVATAATACLLAIGAFFALPSVISLRRAASRTAPLGRVALICVAIAGTSLASVVASSLFSIALVIFAIGSLLATLRLDRVASLPLFPSDAFSWRTPTGVGLWLALLLCVTYSPLQLYVPLFLQYLGGLDPLAAGFAVASASLAWTAASLITAGASRFWSDRLMLAGPVMMGGSLVAIGILAPRAGGAWLVPAIALLGAGIGQCWPFVAHRIMAGAKAGDETVAAASMATVQQIGFALGAAIAGLVANASGLSHVGAGAGMPRAAFWVPTSFGVSAALALFVSLRLTRMRESRAASPDTATQIALV